MNTPHPPPVVPLWAAPLLAPVATVAPVTEVFTPDPDLLRLDLTAGTTAYTRQPAEES